MLKLEYVLDIHREFSTRRTLRDNLGDGYLIEHNVVYRNIREATRAIGFTLSSARFHGYDAFRLSQLANILAERQVPYHDNVAVLEDLEARFPRVLRWKEIEPTLVQNVILHESSHGVAHDVLGVHLGRRLLTAGARADRRRFLVALFLEEAFAGASELMAALHARSKLHDELLNKNSYWAGRELFRPFQSLVGTWGIESVSRLAVLSFLHSCFLYTELRDRPFERVLDVAFEGSGRPRGREKVRLRDLGNLAFRLSRSFRLVVNGWALRTQGIRGPITKALDFDFLDIVEGDQAFRGALDALGEVVARGRRAPALEAIAPRRRRGR